MALCKSYCSHGGRCELDAGHKELHDSRYCQWSDAEALTKQAADAVIATKEGGREYLDTLDTLASMFEAMIDEDDNAG